MADDDRPSPRPRRDASSVRPSPRPRVAGSRRDRDDPSPTPSTPTAEAPAAAVATTEPTAEPRPRARREKTDAPVPAGEPPRRGAALPVALLLLVVAAAVAAGLLLWQRLDPPTVDGSVVSATQDAVEALYAYDYRDSDGSVEGKLAVLTGELRERYETDLASGGIIDTYEQVSATTSYEVLDIGLQRINEAQDAATLVVFGAYVVDSVNSDQQEAPEGSECRVTSDGAQSCTQTVQVSVVQVDGEWKISDLTLLTSS